MTSEQLMIIMTDQSKSWNLAQLVNNLKYLKMQLDVEVSPPAFSWLRGIVHYVKSHVTNMPIVPVQEDIILIYFLRDEFFLVWIFVKLQTDRQTDRKRCIWAHRS